MSQNIFSTLIISPYQHVIMQAFNNYLKYFFKYASALASGFVILGCFEIERSHLANESAGVCGFFYKKQILNNFWGWVCGVGKGI